jgi:competence protein ComEA
MHPDQRKLIIIAVIVAFIVGLIILVTRGERSRDLVLSIEPVAPSDDITVYVGGAVEEPGLYSLPRGSRMSDALDLAGPLATADRSPLDLASTLHDEQSIIVPELPAETADHESESTADHAPAGAVINVNLADANQLQLLPGIGPALAERIIERREAEGPFQTLDELSEIAGISDRMIDDLRDLAVTDS